MPKPTLTIDILASEAKTFAAARSSHPESILFGVTDGKKIGTHVELEFRKYLAERYTFDEGNSAKGIDFPTLNVDMKVTSIKQPQSSCPFTDARQKIFGLGYSLVVFVYDKSDDHAAKTGTLKFLHVIFVDAAQTADFQMTKGLLHILDSDGNDEDLVAYMTDKNLPVDEIEAAVIAEELLKRRPEQGYLTISNARQWRLQYKRVIQQADKVQGVRRIN